LSSASNLPAQPEVEAAAPLTTLAGVAEEDKAVISALYDAFARRDLDAALELFDPAVEFWPQGTAELAERTEPYRGHDGIRAYFRDVTTLWDELRVDPTDFRAAGGGVVVFGTAHGRAGDRVLEQPVIWVWKIRAGRVLFGRVVATAADAAVVAEQQQA
jgi:ketosteroid isomerase-like protein